MVSPINASPRWVAQRIASILACLKTLMIYLFAAAQDSCGFVLKKKKKKALCTILRSRSGQKKIPSCCDLTTLCIITNIIVSVFVFSNYSRVQPVVVFNFLMSLLWASLYLMCCTCVNFIKICKGIIVKHIIFKSHFLSNKSRKM